MTRFYRHKERFSKTSWFFIGLLVVGGILAAFSMLVVIPMGGSGFLLLTGYLLMAVGSIGLMVSILYSLYRRESQRKESHKDQDYTQR